MCGIVGLYIHDSSKHVSQGLVDALTVLQHRGQDAAGIVTIKDNHLNLIKDNGTVADVFTQSNILNLPGNIGIGHVRYPTAGGSCSAEAQPFYTNAPFGIALAHNGNLTNTSELRKAVEEEYRHSNTDSDSEVLLNVFAEELQRRLRTRKLQPEDIFDAVRTVMRRCKGGYAVIMVINTIGLLAFRDPNGIRPLCYGKSLNDPNGLSVQGELSSITRLNGMTSNAHDTMTIGTDYAIASESVAIDILGPSYRFERDVKPGEAIFISSTTGQFFNEIVHVNPVLTPCLFEYVYFARPDSILDGISVYESRINMGSALAKKISSQYSHLDIDVVIPIPETSRTAALHCAYSLQRPYREAFVKNRYIARTFIMPGQEMRRKTVRLKLNTIRSEFKNKNVLLVDDSIVRGTTSLELIQMARDAGAKRVYFASAAPPVKYPNVYGIDIPTTSELIAQSDRTENEIAQILNADQVIYNDLPDVINSVMSLNSSIKTVDASCFNGEYVTGDITLEYLENLEAGRGKGRKDAKKASSSNLSDSSHTPPSSSGSAVSYASNPASNSLFIKCNNRPDGSEIRPDVVSKLLEYSISSGSIHGMVTNSSGILGNDNKESTGSALPSTVKAHQSSASNASNLINIPDFSLVLKSYFSTLNGNISSRGSSISSTEGIGAPSAYDSMPREVHDKPTYSSGGISLSNLQLISNHVTSSFTNKENHSNGLIGLLNGKDTRMDIQVEYPDTHDVAIDSNDVDNGLHDVNSNGKNVSVNTMCESIHNNQSSSVKKQRVA